MWPITRLSFAEYSDCIFVLGISGPSCKGNMFPRRFSESPLNTDIRIIRTLWHVPLVSVLTGFHCIINRL